MTKSNTALAVQVGGDHYKSCAIQPVQFIEANGLGFLEGCVVKRLARHGKPTGKGRQDIEKAIHELQLLLELRYPVAVANDNAAPCEGCTDIVCLKAGKCGGHADVTVTVAVPDGFDQASFDRALARISPVKF